MRTTRHQPGPWLVMMTSPGTFTVPDGVRRYWQAGPGDPIELAVEGDLLRMQPVGKPHRAVLARVLPPSAQEVAN
jgi:bifunctional DNA-binding transcriptional regulator/antitoxin component of YhaV-PrlF toxin-antitoxin module